MKRKVLFLTPAYDGGKSNYIHFFAALQKQCFEREIQLDLRTIDEHSNITVARNYGSACVMLGDWDDVLCVDNDVSCDVKHVFAMLESEHDWVQCAVPLRKYHFDRAFEAARRGHPHPENLLVEFNTKMLRGLKTQEDFLKHLDGKGCLEIDRGGIALARLRRAVFEKMEKAYPELTYAPAEGVLSVALFNSFLEQRVNYAEDMSFAKRWRKNGGRIWLYLDAEVTHRGSMSVTGNFAKAVGL